MSQRYVCQQLLISRMRRCCYFYDEKAAKRKRGKLRVVSFGFLLNEGKLENWSLDHHLSYEFSNKHSYWQCIEIWNWSIWQWVDVLGRSQVNLLNDLWKCKLKNIFRKINCKLIVFHCKINHFLIEKKVDDSTLKMF